MGISTLLGQFVLCKMVQSNHSILPIISACDESSTEQKAKKDHFLSLRNISHICFISVIVLKLYGEYFTSTWDILKISSYRYCSGVMGIHYGPLHEFRDTDKWFQYFPVSINRDPRGSLVALLAVSWTHNFLRSSLKCFGCLEGPLILC